MLRGVCPIIAEAYLALSNSGHCRVKFPRLRTVTKTLHPHALTLYILFVSSTTICYNIHRCYGNSTPSVLYVSNTSQVFELN